MRERMQINRIEQKGRALFLSVVLCLQLLLSGCGASTQAKKVSKSDFYFDTVITITLYGTDEAEYIDDCFALAAKYEQKFSNTLEDSEVSRINAQAGVAPVTVSEETIELIQAGIQYGELSGGSFDITLGGLSDLWNISQVSQETESSGHEVDASSLPKPESIEEALSHVDDSNIHIEKNTVFLEDPEAKIDLGGIAKGYIADRMKEYLNSQGITCGIINLGGNILTLGEKPSGDTYSVGIQKPFDTEGGVIGALSVRDKSVVTSGIYERYFKVGDKIYHHILDLNTGYPYENGLYSVTIISDSSLEGDALSTACFALGLEKGLELIDSMEDVQAVFVTEDYEVHLSDGFGDEVQFREITQ